MLSEDLVYAGSDEMSQVSCVFRPVVLKEQAYVFFLLCCILLMLCIVPVVSSVGVVHLRFLNSSTIINSYK